MKGHEGIVRFYFKSNGLIRFEDIPHCIVVTPRYILAIAGCILDGFMAKARETIDIPIVNENTTKVTCT